MSTGHRYELKFVLDPRNLVKARSWILTGSNARLRYPPRMVNTLYYDSPGRRSMLDNIYGVADRSKYRLRWYDRGDRTRTEGVSFEVKHRTGRLNHKRTFPLPDLTDLAVAGTHGQIKSRICRAIESAPELGHFSSFFPALQVRYEREYLEDARGVRMTIDSRIQFHSTPLNSALFCGRGVSYPHAILEIKFTPQMKAPVADLLRRFKLSPRRHSKYMAGLASFGQAVYF